MKHYIIAIKHWLHQPKRVAPDFADGLKVIGFIILGAFLIIAFAA